MGKFLTLKDHVYDYIAEQIASGNLKANQKVDENAICNELAISRTPVREAFIQLTGEGILQNVPRKGFVVKGMDIDEVSDLYQVIGVLDGMAAAYSIPFLTDKDFDNMEYLIECIDVAIRLKKFDRYYKEQKNFHQIYFDKCPNETLIAEIERLEKKLFKVSESDKPEVSIVEELYRTNNEHREILKLLREGDATGVSNYMAQVHWAAINAIYGLMD